MGTKFSFSLNCAFPEASCCDTFTEHSPPLILVANNSAADISNQNCRGSTSSALYGGTDPMPDTSVVSSPSIPPSIDTNMTLENKIQDSALCSKGTIRTLIVDDIEFQRKIMARLLRGCKLLQFHVSEADDGAVALNMLQANLHNPYDLILMDNIMLKVNGPEAAQEMRSLGFRGLIIGVTGNVLADDVSDYINKGADRVLPKPVVLGDILSSVLSCLAD